MKGAARTAWRSNVFSTFRENEAFFLLCTQVFVLHIGQNLITPILPLYAQTFAIGTTLVGFLISFQGIARVFTNLPAGRLTDRFGANRLLAVAAWIATASAIVAGLAPNYTVLLLTRLTQGIAGAISQTSGLTYTANVSGPDKRARYLSLFQGSFLLGNSVGPVVGGFTAQFFGYRAPFFFYATIALSVGIWMWVRLPDSRLENDPFSRSQKARPPFLTSIRAMLGKPGIILVSLIGLSAAYTRGGSRNMATPLLGRELGLGEGQIGLVLTIIFIATVIVLFLAGTLSDHFGPKKIITPSWLVMALGLIILAQASSYGVFLVGAIVYGLSAGMSAPVPMAYISNSVDADSQGMALGLYRTFNDAGVILGPVIMGWIADQRDISTGVLFNAVLVILAASLFFILAPATPDESIRSPEDVNE